MAPLPEFLTEIQYFEEQQLPGVVRQFTVLISLNLHRRIVILTPVDSGNARANWSLNAGSPDREVRNVGDVGAAQATQIALETGNRLKNLQFFEEVWISNNVVYILALENGHSSQAPAGMVAVSLSALPNDIPRIAAQVQVGL